MAARRSSQDWMAGLWGVLCCWVAVLGNMLLLALDVTVFWIVPLDMLLVPALVTLLLWRWSRG